MRLSPPSALLLGVCVLAACGGGSDAPLRPWRPEDHGQPAETDSREPVPEAAPEAGGLSRAAEALFNVSCAGCHGRDGRGGGPGLPPGVQIPDFTSVEFQKSQTDAAFTQVIADGRGIMPPFGKQVNPEGIVALIGHVRKFAAPLPSTPPAK